MKTKLFTLSLLMSGCLFAHAQDLKPVLSFATAQKIQQGCISYADSSKLAMAIAIFDVDGQLVSFAKMNGAPLGVSKIAQWKGVSAAIYQAPTSQTANWNVPNAPDIATIPGGLPITTKDGYPLGGVGVSGAASAVDVKCAEAGLKAAGLLFPPKK